MIFLVAIPLQILDILWFTLRKVNKNLKLQLQGVKKERPAKKVSKNSKEKKQNLDEEKVEEQTSNKEEND